jgi:hypothetical protein
LPTIRGPGTEHRGSRQGFNGLFGMALHSPAQNVANQGITCQFRLGKVDQTPLRTKAFSSLTLERREHRWSSNDCSSNHLRLARLAAVVM